jgi:hypothetical protein
MPPKAAAEKKPANKAPASKAPAEKKEAGKKTAATGDKKKRTKTRKETYSSYIYKGTSPVHSSRVFSKPFGAPTTRHPIHSTFFHQHRVPSSTPSTLLTFQLQSSSKSTPTPVFPTVRCRS